MIFSIVYYDNNSEVLNFCDHVMNLCDCFIIITDNTGDLDESKFGKNTLVCRPPTNLGYLNGCAFGFRNWLKRENEIPEFLCICNTDIRFLSKLSVFDNNKYDASVGCVAPRVIDSLGHDQNPNIIERPRHRRIELLHTIHTLPIIGACYIALSRIKKKFFFRKKKLFPKEIYSAHGSCFFLTRSFFATGGVIEYGGFLHDEEMHIAEQLRRNKLRTAFDPKIAVFHSAHSSLRFISFLEQSRMHRQSLSWLKNEYWVV